MSDTAVGALNGRVGVPSIDPYSTQKEINRTRTAVEERLILASLLSLCPKAKVPMLFAEQLLKQYGSIGKILAISVHNDRYDELPDEICEFLRIIHQAMAMSLRTQIECRPLLTRHSDLRHYLHFNMAHSDIEQCRLLFLNSRNVLIADELHSIGTVARVAVYVREIAKRAIATGASALIIVHNHPSGDVSVSAEDIAMYKSLRTVLHALEVYVRDNVIVGAGGYRSFREDQIL